MGLGLITLFFLLCFTVLYLSKGLATRPEWLSKAAEKVTDNVQVLSFWGLIYSVIAVVLTPLIVRGGGTILVGVLSNALLFFLILPYMMEHLLQKYQDKVPAPVVEELKNAVAFITSREKIAGYVGAGFSFLLFVVLFR
jgi:hypothetical protein